MSLACEAGSGFLVCAPGPPSGQQHHSHTQPGQGTHLCPGVRLDVVAGGRGGGQRHSSQKQGAIPSHELQGKVGLSYPCPFLSGSPIAAREVPSCPPSSHLLINSDIITLRTSQISTPFVLTMAQPKLLHALSPLWGKMTHVGAMHAKGQI